MPVDTGVVWVLTEWPKGNQIAAVGFSRFEAEIESQLQDLFIRCFSDVLQPQHGKPMKHRRRRELRHSVGNSEMATEAKKPLMFLEDVQLPSEELQRSAFPLEEILSRNILWLVVMSVCKVDLTPAPVGVGQEKAHSIGSTPHALDILTSAMERAAGAAGAQVDNFQWYPQCVVPLAAAALGQRRAPKRAAGTGDVETVETVPTRLALLRFAAPLAAVSVCGPILSTIDTSFVGRCAGTVELAALGPACTVTDLIYLICSTVSTAAINLYAKNSDDEHKMTRFNATCVAVALTVGLVAMVVSMVFGEALLLALGATPVMIEVAKKYVRIRAAGLPLATMACAMYGLCVGRGDTKTPLVVTVYLSAILNVFFDWLLCAQFPFGAAGAAVATVAAQSSSFVAYFALMRRNGHLRLPSFRDFWPSWSETKPVLSIYVPVAFIVVCVLSMYACMSGFVNQTQPLVMMAAYKIWITVFAFFALCADPLAAATSTKLPPFVLKKSSSCARTFFRRAASSAAAVGAGVFTQDPNVIQGAKIGVLPFILILCVMHPTRVCQNSLVVHGDLIFYVCAQTGLSILFFVGLTLLAGRCAIGSISAYRSMLLATLIFYLASFGTYGSRVRYLNRRLGYQSLFCDVSIIVQEETGQNSLSSLLSSLLLRSSNLRDSAGQLLSVAVSRCPSLRELDLSDNHLGPKAVAKLLQAGRDNLQVLDLSCNKLGDEGAKALAEALGKGPSSGYSISVLRLRSNGIGDEGGEALAEALMSITSLKEFDFSENQVTVQISAVMFRAVCAAKALQRLYLDGNLPWPSSENCEVQVTAFTDQLSGPLAVASLEVLSLRRCKMYSSGATKLFESLATNQTLRKLNLACNGIRQSAAHSLAIMLASPSVALEEICSG
eukprot:s273_g5.t3